MKFVVKEENLNNVCFESSKPAVVNHGQGSQDSNNGQRGQNLHYNSWMPEMQKGFLRNLHLQLCHKHGSTRDPDERETGGAMHWDVILPVLKGRFRHQLGKEFTDEDWLHCFHLGSI